MKALLIVTAWIEGGTGLALIVSPSAIASLLFGTELDTPTASTVGRVAGAALLSIGIACWLARNDDPKRSATTLNLPLLLYNTAAVAILAVAGAGSGLYGIGLWPAVALHAAMAIWCVVCLRMH